MALTWIDKPFEKLSNLELYNIMTLRQEVFIVEQDCVYLDNDGKDEGAWHLWAEDKSSNVVAYARILAPNVSYEEASLSRIVTHLDYRSQGLGQELMKRSLDLMESLYGGGQCRISAQSYLLGFYKSFGFKSAGDEYLEDGIPHIQMYR
ncbi:MAG: GNAT family N-acetyltransferase [Bacteroidota bacterium]|nr:GNAT family N-acetyltransferase [Bacteroidota bacterium]